MRIDAVGNGFRLPVKCGQKQLFNEGNQHGGRNCSRGNKEGLADCVHQGFETCPDCYRVFGHLKMTQALNQSGKGSDNA